ncbi:MAG TPA: glycosyltransferase family protein [Longimicrobiales bacterium]
MKRVVIIQARTGSTRLPGKVLMDLAGEPMLGRQLRRLERCRRVDEIVVATTRHAADDAIVSIARRYGVRWFRGDELDVLARYIGAARESGAELIVRITSDCPLIDPEVVDRVVEALERRSSTCDYAANVIERSYPRGLDTEALYADTLERIGRLASSEAAREHVTHFIRERPELFTVHSVVDDEDNSDLRWTVDTREDLELVRRLYGRLELDRRHVPYRAIVQFMRENPELCAINSGVPQKVP